MTVTDIDIWRSAQQMDEQFGDHAPIECAMRADQFGEQNDYAGQALWIKIKAAAEELLKDKPDGEVH